MGCRVTTKQALAGTVRATRGLLTLLTPALKPPGSKHRQLEVSHWELRQIDFFGDVTWRDTKFVSIPKILPHSALAGGKCPQSLSHVGDTDSYFGAFSNYHDDRWLYRVGSQQPVGWSFPMKGGTKSVELRVPSIDSLTDSLKKLTACHLSATVLTAWNTVVIKTNGLLVL